MHTTLISLLLFFQAAQAPKPAAPNVEFWDRVYSSPDGAFNYNRTPNVFLTEVAKELKPGRVLEIGIGQGRNSVYLAKLGWDVTGIDISERGMESARKSAADAAVKIRTINASLESFDYGVDQWDLILGIYEGVAWLKPAVKGLKPGGFIVVEGYTKHRNAPAGAAFGPNELLKIFMAEGLQVVRYEDVKGEPDWLKSVDGVVRMFARKPI